MSSVDFSELCWIVCDRVTGKLELTSAFLASTKSWRVPLTAPLAAGEFDRGVEGGGEGQGRLALGHAGQESLRLGEAIGAGHTAGWRHPGLLYGVGDGWVDHQRAVGRGGD